MGRKIARVFGYILCGLMIALSILLIITAAAFRSSDIVGIFGFNIFVVRTDDIPTAPENSAIIVRKCDLSDVVNGKLLLYTKGENKTPTLGYAKDYYAEDGVYYITVVENGTEYIMPESELVGRADYCSTFLGAVIEFVESPFGIFCLAVLPCIALILYDIIRAFAARMPLPEVVPQVKNVPEEDFVSPSRISVSDDGKGIYSRKTAKSGAVADDVLFSYTAKQKKPDVNNRPIIPLTDKKPAAARKSEPITPITENDVSTFKVEIPEENYNLSDNETDKSAKENVSALRKEEPDDAFFAQSKAPQIGKLLSINSKNDEEEEAEDKNKAFASRAPSKRSSRIIANRRVEDFMKDEDDKRDKNRYEVDDIISGMTNRH